MLKGSFVVFNLLFFGVALLRALPGSAQVNHLNFDSVTKNIQHLQNNSVDFNLENFSYITSIPNRRDLDQTTNVYLGFNQEKSLNEHFKMKAIGRGGYLSESQSSYFLATDLFSSFHFDEMNFSLGRKRISWSRLDSEWNLGQWESKYNVDPLRPIAQGLSGLFLEAKKGKISYTLFVSPFFLPTLSPEVRQEKNGDLTSTSRWAQDPAAEFPLQGKSTQILYSLEVPEIEKIVRQNSSAANMIVGDVNFGPWWSHSLGIKPINDLAVGYKGVLKIKPDQTFGDVTLEPRVVNHRIYSSDIGYSFTNGKVLMGYLRDQPENETPTEGWNYQHFEHLEVLSAEVRMGLYELNGEWAEVGFGRYKASGGATLDRDSKGNSDPGRFSPRVIYKNAVSMDFRGPFYRNGKRKIKSSFKMIHDFEQQGSFFNAGLDFIPTESWKFSLGADILGVNDDSIKNESTGFLNQNRANDRFFAGATYVF